MAAEDRDGRGSAPPGGRAVARVGLAGAVALSLFDELDVVFGPAALADALFYRHSPALRFELEGGKTYIAQFLQAVDRARTVLNVAFAGMEAVTAVLGVWGDDPPAQLWATAEAALHELGIKLPAPELSASELPTPKPACCTGKRTHRSCSPSRCPRLDCPNCCGGASPPIWAFSPS
ncbi:DUF3885 domain-containing protein [Deinococcus radiodurans]|uniref:DUF3885 domain-containing protein n=1 Tax=Deinococcus radiodurans TaxID=1299 RepID=UPI003C7BCAB7